VSILKSNFPIKPVEKDEVHENEFEKKAKESIGGSMVFVERKLKYWNGVSETPDADNPDRAGTPPGDVA